MKWEVIRGIWAESLGLIYNLQRSLCCSVEKYIVGAEVVRTDNRHQNYIMYMQANIQWLTQPLSWLTQFSVETLWEWRDWNGGTGKKTSKDSKKKYIYIYIYIYIYLPYSFIITSISSLALVTIKYASTLLPLPQISHDHPYTRICSFFSSHMKIFSSD